MSLPSLDELYDRIVNGGVIRLPQASDCDEALNRRDDDKEFERLWLEAHAAAGSAPREDSERIEEVARAAFLAAFAQMPEHEIASYVSDDLQLIARAAANRASLPFVEELWGSYLEYGFAAPHGQRA